MNSVLMRYPGGKTKAVTFSYDDGIPQDIRLADLISAYGMKATFNFNCACIRDYYTKEQIKEIFLSRGHEIATHGALHRANGTLRPIQGIREVLDCRLELEAKCEQIIRGLAYPNSGITYMTENVTYEQIKHYLTELDIAYARTLGGDNNTFMLPEDFYNWIPSAHHDNPKIMAYIDEFLQLDISHNSPSVRPVCRLLYIWGHSYEFDRNDNWDHMESICQKLAFHDDIWYATNIEICDYVQAYKKLLFSADERMVYNPTCTKIWLDIDYQSFCVEPGQTVVLPPMI